MIKCIYEIFVINNNNGFLDCLVINILDTKIVINKI